MSPAPRRRAPRTTEQRVAQHLQNFDPGALKGLSAHATPLIGIGNGSALAKARGVGAPSGGSGATLAFQDVFTLSAAGAQAKTLTYLPLLNSEHVYLNGLYQRETVDWTRLGLALSVLAAMDARTGDVLAVEYLYSSDVPVPGSTVLPFLSSGWKYLQVALGDTVDRSPPTFNDSTWAVGRAAFGQVVGAFTAADFGAFNTVWAVDTRLWIRRSLGPNLQSASITYRIDNTLQAYWNGTVFLPETATASFGEITIQVPASLLGGDNVLAVRASDDFSSSDGGLNDRSGVDIKVTTT